MQTTNLDLLVCTNEHVLRLYVPQHLGSIIGIHLSSYQGVQQVIQLLLFEVDLLHFSTAYFVRKEDRVVRVVRLL